MSETGHQIAVNGAARHIENVVGEFHVDTTDAPTRHDRFVAVVEMIDDMAPGHEERVEMSALVQAVNLAASHPEIIDAVALLQLTVDFA